MEREHLQVLAAEDFGCDEFVQAFTSKSIAVLVGWGDADLYKFQYDLLCQGVLGVLQARGDMESIKSKLVTAAEALQRSSPTGRAWRGWREISLLVKLVRFVDTFRKTLDSDFSDLEEWTKPSVSGSSEETLVTHISLAIKGKQLLRDYHDACSVRSRLLGLREQVSEQITSVQRLHDGYVESVAADTCKQLIDCGVLLSKVAAGDAEIVRATHLATLVQQVERVTEHPSD